MGASNAVAVAEFLEAARVQLKFSNGLDVPFAGTTAPRRKPRVILASSAGGGNAVHLGFVCGGGGAKGDFQVGAINAIYQLFQLDSGVGTPPPIDIITGISVGSLASSALASSPFATGRTTLNNVWNGITGPSSIYVDGPQLASLRTLINQVAIDAAVLGPIIAAGATGFVGAVAWPLAVPMLDPTVLTLLTGAVGMMLGLAGPAGTALTAVGAAISSITSSGLLPTATTLSSVFGSAPSTVSSILTTLAVPITVDLTSFSALANGIVSNINAVSAALGAGGVLALLGDPIALAAFSTAITTLLGAVGVFAAAVTTVSAAGLAAATTLASTLVASLSTLLTLLTSIGTMIGSLVALAGGTIATLAALDLSPITALITAIPTVIDVVNVIQGITALLNDPSTTVGLFSFAPLFALLQANLTAADVANINSGPTALHIGFTSLESTRYRFADQSWTRANLLTAIHASASQPVFFPAVPMSLKPSGTGTYVVNSTSPQESYVDGGVRSVVALSPAIRAMENPTTGRKFHLNIVFVLACSNLMEVSTLKALPTPGPVAGILNTLLRTLGIFELTQYADAMLEADTGIREAFAESSGQSFAQEFDYLAQHAKVIWSTGAPPPNFPSLHDLTGRHQDRGKPMPGDTIIILIEPSRRFDEYHSPFDFNATSLTGIAGIAPGSTIIGESIKYGAAMAQFILTGGTRPTWSLESSFESGTLQPFDPLAAAV
jgi:predicted acylesterase/phospholipase RssA